METSNIEAQEQNPILADFLQAVQQDLTEMGVVSSHGWTSNVKISDISCKASLGRDRLAYWVSQAMEALAALQSWTEINESVSGLPLSKILETYTVGSVRLTELNDYLTLAHAWVSVVAYNDLMLVLDAMAP